MGYTIADNIIRCGLDMNIKRDCSRGSSTVRANDEQGGSRRSENQSVKETTDLW